MAAELPQVTEGSRHGNRTWFVNGKGFVWERPFTKADVRRFGETPPPAGPIVAFRVADLEEKDFVLAAASGAFFTIPHFDGYPGLLIQLDAASLEELQDAIVNAWLACAPPRLMNVYLASHDPGD